ncbi:MAG: hypothetical protein H0X66_11415 [Verrucomicrobia bacterium]|nr:hypothetical protein [Verrucomicrobiota bacterium]
MKLTLANHNRAFTRTQWLLIICLAVVAFEVGTRYAKQQFAPPQKAKATNLVATNLLLTAQEPSPEEIEFIAPPTTNVPMAPVQHVPPTNHYVRPPTGTPGQSAQSQMLKAGGPVTRHKVHRITNAPPYGIRIAVP